ncbi:phospholipase D alpha 4 [Mercurialis annua]|uniref:phospholipase D alpha 4 n=1 Tax=Mercurialis annua TaxID=3986 RepID=UPI00215E4618|nr:phospholipase D alpha 4 [Mercurialis annua]
MESVQKFLHGTLEVTIFDATPYSSPFPLNCLFTNGKPTYVTIKIGNKKVSKTSQEHDRIWNQTFRILCAHPLDSIITITMKTKCTILGKFHIQAEKIVHEATFIDGFFPLIMENGKPNHELKLRFMLWFKPAEFELSWRKITSNGQFQGLRNATFPQRSNCHVTFYQDAHHHNTFQPPLGICGSPRNLWEDVYRAIDGAKHLIYIAGWSFNPKMALVRDPGTSLRHARGVKLGELLKRKADEGVAVRIMIWNDETSLPIIKNKGVMKTHDEDAFAYFRHTKVICKLCPRLHHKFPTFFAHHQKTITVDTRTNNDLREIMSFIGGLDLCDGRFDTEQHSLFQTLNTQSHCNDFYQTSIGGASLHKGGPREPWHDAHARILGEAAWDILTNFEQRWTKQCDTSSLLSTPSISNLTRDPVSSSNLNDRNWKVQVFRSIDHVSVTPLARNLKVEQSIHEAYVEAIRRADRFIYIENQYFIGGCDLWDNNKHCGCRNLIPIEIALKIVSKIKAKQRFAVYILIPMWPEGVPESDPVQDILHWTRETMAMMYKLIGEALEESGEPLGHPRDYLNFFCLANREEEAKKEFVPPYSPHKGTQYWNAQKNRRFMVYVHSKLIIVDDEYIIIGSANVNQRSMDGKRDTEIAIGCYQQDNARSIQAYRMSLWYEHTGLAEEMLLEPQSLECVHRIYSLGEGMWNIYSGEEVVDMEGVHLVNYPIKVPKDGIIEDLDDGNGNFPDTKAPVKGRRSQVLPCIFTT